MSYDYDVLVIGAGSGGLTASIGAARVGKKVCLIEKGPMGGDCTNTGCIPSKTLIHHAREYFTAKQHAGSTPKLIKYRKAVLQHVRKKIDEILHEESPDVLKKKYNVTVKKGVARFYDAHTVIVATGSRTQKITARYIVVATGSHPRMVEIPGLNAKDMLTNKNLFELTSIPDELVILGGGVIGCEMAEAFAMLDVSVTIVTNADRLLPREEFEVSQIVYDRFVSLGISIKCNATIASCSKKKALVVSGKKEEHIVYDKVLIAVGRKASFEGLDLGKIGIRTHKDGIIVDRHYRTSQKNIFAIGDVSSTHKFTHVADDQGRYIVRKMLLPWCTFPSQKPIPRVTFLQQEIASVGLTYAKALKKYCAQEIIKLELPFSAADRSKTDDAPEGTIIVIAKRVSGKMLGATIMGESAGELLSVFVLAMQEKISLWKVNAMIAAYPTRARLIKKISDQFIGATFKHLKKDVLHLAKKHAPKVVALLFWAILAWTFFSYKARYSLSSLDIMRELYAYLTGTMYGPFLYILVYTVRPLILFPATLLTLLSGALFGFWGGTLYTIVGENMSANLAYFMGRIIGKDIIPSEGNGLIATWKRRLQENSFVSVFIMRLIYLPFDMVNYVCGILHIRWISYFLATLIGIMPGLVTFVSFGASIENIEEFDPSTITIDPSQLFISIGLFIVSLFIARMVRKRHKTA